MNNDRRKELRRAHAILETLQADIEALRDAEQDAYDNLPESIQNSERGEKIQEAIDALDSAVTNIETAKDDLEGI